MLGQLAADDGAAGQAAPGRDARHHLANLVRVDLAQQLVVEEEQRPGPAAHQVVHAHGDQVDPDRVEAAGRHGHRHLGADPIGARDQHRAAVAGRAPRTGRRSPRSRRSPPGRSAVEATRSRMASTAWSAASMSTPAAA